MFIAALFTIARTWKQPKCNGRRERVSPHCKSPAQRLWVSSLLPSSPQGSCRDQVIRCNFLWPMSAWCPKITGSWGDAWPSTNMPNAHSSALAALQILAVGILLAKWKIPATQSKPKPTLSRLRAFSFPQNSDVWLNNSGSLPGPIKLNLLSTSFIFPWHHVYLTCKKPSPLSVITSSCTSFKREGKKKRKEVWVPQLVLRSKKGC